MDQDQAYLRAQEWPGYEEGGVGALRVVDLFAGCGGLTLGVAEAARRAGMSLEIALAVDFMPEAVEVYRHAFRKLDPRVELAPVESFFDGELGAQPTPVERELAAASGPVDVLVGGPPCQGHSDLNNHTRRDDPRNAFYARMARAAEILHPALVLIENVPAVRHDREGIVDLTFQALRDADYSVATDVVDLSRLGVPQTRRRHVLLALRSDRHPDADTLLSPLNRGTSLGRDLAWAIADLVRPESRGPLDTPSRVTPPNQERMAHLFDNDAYDLPDRLRPECHRDGGHSYNSVYGRLRWDRPSQTITSGFGSMGQGRYVHPEDRRTLTPHEAARLQFFPDWFDFTAGGAVMKRGAWAKMIGNAVPTKLSMEIVGQFLEGQPGHSDRARPQ